MSIASRIQEMETHINNAYTSIDNLGIDISNTNKNIYNISTLLDTFYERLPKVSGIGASLSLSPSLMGKIKLNEIQGDTLQNGTPTPSSPIPIQSVTGLQNVGVCGKNLFDGTIYKENYVINSSGVESYNTSFNLYKISLKPNTTYTIQFKSTDSAIRSSRYIAYKNDGTFISMVTEFTYNAGESVTQTFTTPNETSYILYHIGKLVEKVQIEKGPTATTYESYTGNTYEVNLGNIELNKIGDYEDSIKKSTGKNLIDINNLTNGYLTYLNGIDPSTSWRITDYIPIKPNTTYTTSGMSTPGENPSRCYYDINKTFISGIIHHSQNPFTDESPNNAYYVRESFNANDINNIMLNEGSTALPYEPYGKVWYKEKNIGNVVLDGSEGISESTQEFTNVKRYSLWRPKGIIFNNIVGSSSGYNNQLLIIDGFNLDSEHLYLYNEQLYMFYNKTNIVDVTALKTFLSNNNLIIYGILKTPTTEIITNTELIEQLESLNNAKSKDGTTNINVTSENLSMLLNVGVIKGDA